MSEHLFLPGGNLRKINLVPEHKKWLCSWLENIEINIENDIIASSECLQGAIVELAIHGKTKHDWVGIMEEYLSDGNGNPIAYSENYGRKLCSFNQWLQTTVHSIHTRWWIERELNEDLISTRQYSSLLENFIQPNGWVYNPDVSCTGLRTRIQSEVMMSMAMSAEIFNFYNCLDDKKGKIEATISSKPLTKYLCTEFFRLKILDILGVTELAPKGLEGLIKSCEAGMAYCDFNVSGKVDDYMGTAKRTTRDKSIQSPLISLHARFVSEFCDEETRKQVEQRLTDYGKHLEQYSFDIPAFKMRDIDIPFGSDITPIEIIAASVLII